MPAYVRKNALDQALDIAGSLLQSDTRTLSNEPDGYGAPISGQTGSAANITSLTANGANVTGLTGMTAASVGRFLTLSGTASLSNTGTFLIDGYVDDGYVTIVNASAVANDANNGSIVWTERNPYTLEDDINFARTDRRLIKGTAAFHSAVPTYQRPSAIGTNVPANLTNIAGKTLDAHAWVVNRVFRADPVAPGDGYSTITDTGLLQYADAVDRTGVPIWDGFDAGNWEATYVEIINPVTENYLVDGYTGQRIFGRTRQGTSGVEPNSVEIEFRKVAFGADISTSTAYTWDGYQPTAVDYYYGYRERADQLTETAFRTTLVNGLFADSQSATNINNILTTLGTTLGDTYLTGLTNLTNYYVFSDLPDGTPSVTEVFNTINEQIGDRIFTGSVIGDNDGYTITQILQNLANAIASANFVRVIERLTVDVSPGVPHTLPGGNTYTLDPTNNGQNLIVYTRGLLRDPGPVVDFNDYAETSTTSITFYAKQKAGDHINYFIYA